MKYFTKIAKETTHTKSPLWSHEAGTDRATAIKKDFKGLNLFSDANAPMLSDTTSTTFTSPSTGENYQVDKINHMSYNPDGNITGMNKTDTYKLDADGNKVKGNDFYSTQKGGKIPKDKALEIINSTKDSRGYKSDRLPKEGSLSKVAGGPLLAIPAALKMLLGIGGRAVATTGARAIAGTGARAIAGTGARAIAGGGARAAAGGGGRALATTGGGALARTGVGAGGAGAGSWFSRLLTPTWGKAGLASMFIPWGGGAKSTNQAANTYNKMAKLPGGDMSFWQGSKNWTV